MRLNHHSQSTQQRRQRPSRWQQGYVLVMFAMLLVPMLLVTGLSVDVGLWYNRTSDMRKAADAGALAGVVWLPDEAAARSAALAATARNGFTNGVDDVTVTVNPSTVVARRLKVTITDSSVGSFFYRNLGGSDIDLTRTAFAEYVLPVPMGSPRNFFGTGRLLEANPPGGGGFTSEELWQSVNTYCSDKVNGDRHQPKSPVGSRCGGSNNTERKPYELYIDAVEGRPAEIEVLLYDPRFSTADVPNNSVVGQDCTVVPADGAVWQTFTTSSNRTIYGPKVYQYYSSGRWRPDPYAELETGEDFSYRGDRLRWAAGVETCVDVYGVEPEIDRYFSGSGDEVYTFTLYYADNTPLNDSDNVVKCSQTFSATTPFNYSEYLGSVRWNKLCSISTSDPDGRYILRVQNSGTSSPFVDGENNWGLVAKYTSGGLCDGRVDNMCPRVYGKESISVRALANTTVASFFLAEIAGEHAGKMLKIELYDPGEGGTQIEIMQPTGSGGNSWTPHSFTWSSPGVSGSPSGNTSAVPVTGSRFNGRVLTIMVDLTGYSPPSDNNWWKIRYTFGGTVNDRTTWAAEILGDPIHLVEEF